MKSVALHTSTYAAALALLSCVSANTRLPGSTFLDKPFEAAQAAAPMWNFGRPGGSEPCYPSKPVNDDGTMPSGTIADLGRLGSLNDGCGSIGPWNGHESPGNWMPTYYTLNFCQNDKTWRVTYFLYFSHDSGHRYDWEWVSVLWLKDLGDADTWFRSAIKTSFHRDVHTTLWGDIQNTIDTIDQRGDFGGKDRDHPKVFVGAFHHAMFLDRYTGLGTLGADDKEFRSNDWYFMPVFDDALLDGLKNPNFDFTDPVAHTTSGSNPFNYHDDYDICGK